MGCHVDTSVYQLHLYQDYPSDAPDCWSNSNLYLVKPDTSGNYSAQSPRVTEAVTNEPYFFVASVKNNGEITQLLEMQFGIPSFMVVAGENQKTVIFKSPSRIAAGALVAIPSAHPIQFIHPGNYEMYVQIKNWRNPSIGEQPPSDWPKKGPLYARNSITVKSKQIN